MTGTTTSSPAPGFPFHDALMRVDVEYMSTHLLGTPYSEVQKIIYPTPPYKVFVITKRSGAPRLIQEPRRKLKELQLKVLAFLEEHGGRPKPCVHGFTKNRSIVTNARKHCARQTQHLLNIDLKDFFPSIGFFRVRGVLQKSHSRAPTASQPSWLICVLTAMNCPKVRLLPRCWRTSCVVGSTAISWISHAVTDQRTRATRTI